MDALPTNLLSSISQIHQVSSQEWRTLFQGKIARDAVENSGRRVHGTAHSEDRKSPIWHVLSRLGHVPVNPSKPLNTEFLINSYTFADEAFTRVDKTRVVNRSEEATRAFVEQLADCARYQNDALNSSDEVLNSTSPFESDRMFFLTGGKGVGKTYYLNYVLSKYNDYLDNQSVIWVRVNLLTDRAFDGNISHRVSAQVAKILLKYYDQDSSFYQKRPLAIPSDFGKHLSRWIDERFSEPPRRRELHERADTMKESFYRRHKDEPISPELCPKLLCDEIFAYAKKNGVGFIVVLDGYDRLEADIHQTERFRLNQRGVISLLENYELSGFVCVVCMRTVTYEFEVHSHPQFKSFRNNRYRVASTSLEALITRRIESIVRELPKHPIYKSAEELEEWIGLLRKFALHLFTVTADEESLLETVTTAFGENNRTKMSAVRVEFQTYIAPNFRQGYKVFEQLMKMGNDYPPIYFQFRRGASNLEFSIHDEADYDNRVLPVIFLPPLAFGPTGAIDPATPLTFETVLLGVRILQVVGFFDAWLVSQPLKEPLYLHELSEVLEEQFGYEPEQTMAAVIVLESFECINLKNADLGGPISSDVQLSLTNKAKLILERGIRDVAVLNLSAMRLKVRPDLEAKFSIFVAAVFDGSARSLRHWIRTKVTNSVVLSALVASINDEQERQFNVKKLKGRTALALQARRSYSHMFSSLRVIGSVVVGETSTIINQGLTQGSIDSTDIESISLKLREVAEVMRRRAK